MAIVTIKYLEEYLSVLAQLAISNYSHILTELILTDFFEDHTLDNINSGKDFQVPNGPHQILHHVY
jgi:hypothetical protein